MLPNKSICLKLSVNIKLQYYDNILNLCLDIYSGGNRMRYGYCWVILELCISVTQE